MVSYSFQDGSTLEITVKGDVETEKALRMAMALINLKFDEIGVQAHRTTADGVVLHSKTLAVAS